MGRTTEISFESHSFSKQLNSMLKVDFRRMFTMPLFYIVFGIALVMPVLILVMTTMMDGTVTVDPNTGVETTIEAFQSTWQIIASASGDSSSMSMDLTGMCNINLIYFITGVLVCLFVSEDFRSGYAKNLFTVRAGKGDYVVSKILVGFVCGALLLSAFLAGAVLGGRISGLPFDLGTAGVSGLVMCMLSKLFLMGVFVALFLTMCVVAKQKTWLCILLSLFAGMLLFMMIPMMTPLDSGMMNVIMCLTGGVLFALGLGAVSSAILRKTSLV